MSSDRRYVLGLDFGTSCARALIVDPRDGREIATATADYPGPRAGEHGSAGVYNSPTDPNLARQHPLDYEHTLGESVRRALAAASTLDPSFEPDSIAGIGIDATGSTPLPVDASCRALGATAAGPTDLASLAWLWKDHTSHEEAAEITDLARRTGRPYLATCGGAYSSEWFWAKALRCVRTAPNVARQAAAWVELSDYLPALLTGSTDPATIARNVCAAGHKALHHPAWNGLPDEEFLNALDATGTLARWRAAFAAPARKAGESAGKLSEQWADALGLRAGIPVAVGALDAHMGAVGSGVGPGTMVKIIGTSTCDCLVAPILDERDAAGIPGISGVVPHSIIPGMLGIEAGQSAVGDIFNWFASKFGGGGADAHARLTDQASKFRPGESGLLALDWHNGNRNILADPRLSGLMLGQSLTTDPAESYLSLIESTAFCAKTIVDRLCTHGAQVAAIVCCGGVSAQNSVLMQVYADVMNMPMHVSGAREACALGSAMCAAVAAGVHGDLPRAQRAMCAPHSKRYEPIAENVRVYARLFALYKRVHDAFGGVDRAADLSGVMKELLAIRDGQRRGRG